MGPPGQGSGLPMKFNLNYQALKCLVASPISKQVVETPVQPFALVISVSASQSDKCGQ